MNSSFFAEKNRDTKLLLEHNTNHYLQDLTNNYLIFLPEKLLDALKTGSDKKNGYYHEKAAFLFKYLSNERSVEENYSGRLSPYFIKKSLVNTQQITFELTEGCNLRCGYCGYGELYGDYGDRSNKNLPWEYIESVINFLKKFWESDEYPSFQKKIAIGFYGGEPLLKMDLIEKIVAFLEKTENSYLSFSYHITTNGVLLDRYMNFLVEKDMNISISLDGNELNNEYRITKSGKSSHQQIVKNIDELKARYSDFFDKNVQFISVLHNKNSMSDIYDFFKTKYSKIPVILEVNPDGIKEEMLDRYNEMYSSKSRSLNNSDKYSEMKKELFISEPGTYGLMHYLHAYSGNIVKDYSGFYKDKENMKWLPTGTCVPFSKKKFVTATGKILPCERIGHQYAIGLVDKDGVYIDFEKIAETYNKYYDNLEKKCCFNCYGLKHCVLCIFNLEGGIEKNPKCYRHINEKQVQKYIKDKIAILQGEPDLYNKIMTDVILE